MIVQNLVALNDFYSFRLSNNNIKNAVEILWDAVEMELINSSLLIFWCEFHQSIFIGGKLVYVYGVVVTQNDNIIPPWHDNQTWSRSRLEVEDKWWLIRWKIMLNKLLYTVLSKDFLPCVWTLLLSPEPAIYTLMLQYKGGGCVVLRAVDTWWYQWKCHALRHLGHVNVYDVLLRPSPGPRFNVKMSSYQYRKYHCGDISTMWFPILVIWHLYIELWPWWIHIYFILYSEILCKYTRDGNICW